MLLKRITATGVNTSDLAAKKDFIVLKAGVDKLDINKLVNIPNSLQNLKNKRRWFRCWLIENCPYRL